MNRNNYNEWRQHMGDLIFAAAWVRQFYADFDRLGADIAIENAKSHTEEAQAVADTWLESLESTDDRID